MAYKTNRDFIANRINEWADIREIEDDTERGNAMEKWNEYYGEDNPCAYTMFLCLYRVTQGYGGPEEGGWWVTLYEPFACIPVTNRERALAALELLDTEAQEYFGDQREYYSAAGGEDGHIVFESRRFASADTEIPRYE